MLPLAIFVGYLIIGFLIAQMTVWSFEQYIEDSEGAGFTNKQFFYMTMVIILFWPFIVVLTAIGIIRNFFQKEQT